MYSVGDHEAKLNLCLKPAFYKERLWLTFHPPSHPCLWDKATVCHRNSFHELSGGMCWDSKFNFYLKAMGDMGSACVRGVSMHAYMHACKCCLHMHSTVNLNGWVVCEREREKESVCVRARTYLHMYVQRVIL